MFIGNHKTNLIKQKRISCLKQIYFNWEKVIFGENINVNEVPIPYEYNKLMNQSSDAYYFYRNWYYYYVQTLTNDHVLIDEFFNFVNEIEYHNPEDFWTAMKYFQEDIDLLRIFNGQHQNAFELFPNVHQDENVTQTLIHLYQAKFENKAMLTILCVMVRIRKNKKFNLELTNFQDRNGNLIKGKIVNSLLDNIEVFDDYPILKESFSKGYNAQLRNIVGHNNFVLDHKNKMIKNLSDESAQMSYEEFYECMFQLQQLQNGILNYMGWKSIEKNTLKGKGIVSSSHGLIEEKEPILILYRLYPFQNIEDENNLDLDISLKLDCEYLYVFVNQELNSFISLERTISFFEKVSLGKSIEIVFQYISPAYDPHKDTITLDNGFIGDNTVHFYLGDFHIEPYYEKTSLTTSIEPLATLDNYFSTILKK